MALLDRYEAETIRQRIAVATPAELPHLLELLNRELAGLTGEELEAMRNEPALLAAYVTRGRKDTFKLWQYQRLLSAQFVKAVEGVSRFQIWNLPARYGKSMTGSKWGPVWLLETHPEARIILTSYGYSLARENAVFVRNTLEGNPDVFGTRLLRDRRAANRFNTAQGGGVLAAGLGGAITGFGAGAGGGIVIDDPFKNWQEAHSEQRRELVWNEYQSVLRLRLDDESAWIIVIQTRWHEDDLTGRLLEREPDTWELVRLPALAEPFDPNSHDPYARMADRLGRKAGEPLEPERFSLVEVQARAVSLGSYLSAGLEQQRPAPSEGGEIKRAWWKWIQQLPADGDAWATSWDMKLKEKETGDFVVGQAWSRTGSAFFCHDQLRGQWSMLKTECAICLLAVRNPKARRHYIENTGNGPEVMDVLRAGDPNFRLKREIGDELAMTPAERKAVVAVMRRGLPGILPVNPKGSKVARARAVSAFIEAGNVWLPEGKDWALALVDESSAFPHGLHDDMVDCWSQALAALSGKIAPVAAPGGGTQTSHWRGA